MKAMAKTLLVLGLLAAGGAAALYSGVYDVGADAPHTRPVRALLEFARERSIGARASRLEAPAGLDDPARIRRGAGNYDAMCAGCHLKPGAPPTELSQGLYPAPPDLTRTRVPAARAFWVVKHGIKASGMPAWGRSMGDEHLWNLAAFVQQLPQLDRAAYDALVASSEGHSHGGGESEGHSHGHGGSEDRHGEAEPGADASRVHDAPAAAAPAAAGVEHVHADGRAHVHARGDERAGNDRTGDDHAH